LAELVVVVEMGHQRLSGVTTLPKIFWKQKG
jgi:hypothetical protein